jgi:hypothetical protein
VNEELVYLGVDIAKAYLDAAIGNEKRRFSNDAIGPGRLIQWLKQIEEPVQVICEPSGGYERALVRALVAAQIKVSLVPANRVRQFARAGGILPKTDRIDAKLLCAFGEGDEARDNKCLSAGARTVARTGKLLGRDTIEGSLVVTALTGMLQIWVASEHMIRPLSFAERPNQSMKPTARLRENFRVFATDPARGLSLSRRSDDFTPAMSCLNHLRRGTD